MPIIQKEQMKKGKLYTVTTEAITSAWVNLFSQYQGHKPLLNFF